MYVTSSKLLFCMKICAKADGIMVYNEIDH